MRGWGRVGGWERASLAYRDERERQLQALHDVEQLVEPVKRVVGLGLGGTVRGKTRGVGGGLLSWGAPPRRRLGKHRMPWHVAPAGPALCAMPEAKRRRGSAGSRAHHQRVQGLSIFQVQNNVIYVFRRMMQHTWESTAMRMVGTSATMRVPQKRTQPLTSCVQGGARSGRASAAAPALNGAAGRSWQFGPVRMHGR